MIDQIELRSVHRGNNGQSVDVIRVWIGGVPFSADLGSYSEAIAQRVASRAEVPLMDHRPTPA